MVKWNTKFVNFQPGKHLKDRRIELRAKLSRSYIVVTIEFMYYGGKQSESEVIVSITGSGRVYIKPDELLLIHKKVEEMKPILLNRMAVAI